MTTSSWKAIYHAKPATSLPSFLYRTFNCKIDRPKPSYQCLTSAILPVYNPTGFPIPPLIILFSLSTLPSYGPESSRRQRVSKVRRFPREQLNDRYRQLESSHSGL